MAILLPFKYFAKVIIICNEFKQIDHSGCLKNLNKIIIRLVVDHVI